MEPSAHEVDAVEGVCHRLTERFPDVPPDTIERTVREIHGHFDGPIRDYVPVLVEHQARDHFTALTRRPRQAALTPQGL